MVAVPESGIKVKVWASWDLPALVITKIPTETGEVMDWLWNGGTATIKWFWKKIQKDNHVFNTMSWIVCYIKAGRFDTAVYIIQGETEGYTEHSFTYTWWKRSISIFASACQELSSKNKTTNILLFFYPAEVYMQKPISTLITEIHLSTTKDNTDHTKLATAPAMFSWKITLVPLRKFFPMIKTSSPPLTEQLWRLFFRISGTPAGWAGEWQRSQSKLTWHLGLENKNRTERKCFVLMRPKHWWQIT